jgi:hypothetical protein
VDPIHVRVVGVSDPGTEEGAEAGGALCKGVTLLAFVLVAIGALVEAVGVYVVDASVGAGVLNAYLPFFP